MSFEDICFFHKLSSISAQNFSLELIPNSQTVSFYYKDVSVYQSGGLPAGEVALSGGVQKKPYVYILQPRHPGVKFLKITDSSLSTKNYGQNDMFWLLMLFCFLPDIYLCGTGFIYRCYRSVFASV